jgi:hypothetical protein
MKESNEFWSNGSYAKTMSKEEIDRKMKTFHKRHDEDMRFNCRVCKKKISSHNNDWHDSMCDDCFNKVHFSEE